MPSPQCEVCFFLEVKARERYVDQGQTFGLEVTARYLDGLGNSQIDTSNYGTFNIICTSPGLSVTASDSSISLLAGIGFISAFSINSPTPIPPYHVKITVTDEGAPLPAVIHTASDFITVTRFDSLIGSNISSYYNLVPPVTAADLIYQGDLKFVHRTTSSTDRGIDLAMGYSVAKITKPDGTVVVQAASSQTFIDCKTQMGVWVIEPMISPYLNQATWSQTGPYVGNYLDVIFYLGGTATILATINVEQPGIYIRPYHQLFSQPLTEVEYNEECFLVLYEFHTEQYLRFGNGVLNTYGGNCVGSTPTVSAQPSSVIVSGCKRNGGWTLTAIFRVDFSLGSWTGHIDFGFTAN